MKLCVADTWAMSISITLTVSMIVTVNMIMTVNATVNYTCKYDCVTVSCGFCYVCYCGCD